MSPIRRSPLGVCRGRRAVVGILSSDPTAPPSLSLGVTVTVAAAGSPAAWSSTSAASRAASAFKEALAAAAAAAARGKRRGGARAQNGIFARVFVSGHKFYVCDFRTKHKICILAYHNLCFCVFVFLGIFPLFGSAHVCDSEGWGFIPVCSRPTNGERLRSSLVSHC